MYLEWEPPQRLLGASETRLREQREGGGDGASRVHLALASGNTHGVAHDDWRRTSFFFFFFCVVGLWGPEERATHGGGAAHEQSRGAAEPCCLWSRTLDRPRSPGDSLCRLYVPILTCNATHRRAHVWRLGARCRRIVSFQNLPTSRAGSPSRYLPTVHTPSGQRWDWRRT